MSEKELIVPAERYRLEKCTEIQKDFVRFKDYCIYTNNYPCMRCGSKPSCEAHFNIFIKERQLNDSIRKLSNRVNKKHHIR